MTTSNLAIEQALPLRRLLRDAAVLAAALAVAAIPVGLWAWQAYGSIGLTATAVAAGVCFGSAMLALLIAYVLRDPAQAVTGMVLGMGIRMGAPMLFGIYMTQTEQPLAAAGLFAQIMLFYLVGLCVETVLHVGQLKRRDAEARAVVGESPAASQTS